MRSLGIGTLRSVQIKYTFTIKYSDVSLKSFGWNNVGPASQTVAQQYINIGPMYRVIIWCFCHRDGKRHQHNGAVRKYGKITQCCFYDGQRRRLWVNIETALCECHVYSRPGDRFMLGQRRRRLTGIEPAIGCNAGPTLYRNLLDRPTSSVRCTS